MNKKLVIPIIIIIIALALLAYYITCLLKSSGPEEALDPTIQAIKDRGEIIIGTNPAFPPMESIDEQGNLKGIDIEIAKKIAEDLGVNAKFQPVEWQDIFDTLIAGQVDMIISGITILPERAEKMIFSNPYFNAGQVIVIRMDQAQEIQGLEDVTGKKIGAQKDTTGFFEAEKLSDNVAGYIDYAAAKQALLDEEIEIIVVDYPVGINLVNGEQNMLIVGEPFTQEFYGVAVSKDNQALIEQINQTLVYLKKSGELDTIINQWIKK